MANQWATDRRQAPTRASTLGSTEPDRPKQTQPQSHSEDLNHTRSSSPRTFLPYIDDDPANRRASLDSLTSSSSNGPKHSQSLPAAYVTFCLHLVFKPPSACSSCGKVMQGPFVRALGTVFHLNCFKCMVSCIDSFKSLTILSLGLWRRGGIKVLPN